MPPPLPTTLVNTITSHTGPINALTFSSQGGTYLLSGSSDRSIHLSRTLPSESSSSPPSSSSTSSFSSTPIQTYTSHGYPILSLTCSPSNTTFASSGGDRAVFLWDVTSATTLRRFGSTNASQSHTGKINSVTFAGDGGDALLVSGSDDTSVRVWDVRSRSSAPVMVLSEARDAVSVVAIANEVEIVAGSVDGRVRSYDVRTGKCTVDRLPAPVTGLRLTRDGRAMAVATLDDRVRMLERVEGKMVQAFPKEKEEQQQQGPHFGGREGGKSASTTTTTTTTIGNGNGSYRNRDVRLKATFGLREEVLMSGSEADGKVHVWDVLTGLECASVEPLTAGPRPRRPQAYSLREGEVKDPSKTPAAPAVVSVVEWRGEGGMGDVWACGGVEGRVWIYGDGGNGNVRGM